MNIDPYKLNLGYASFPYYRRIGPSFRVLDIRTLKPLRSDVVSRLFECYKRPQSIVIVRYALGKTATAAMDYRVILDKGVVRSLQVPHCLLGEPLRVDGRCLTGGGGVVSE